MVSIGKATTERKEKAEMAYYVNIADCTKDKVLGSFLIGPVLDGGSIVDAEPGMIDGVAARLNCTDEQAEAIIGVVRLRRPSNLFRFYQGKPGRKTYKRI